VALEVIDLRRGVVVASTAFRENTLRLIRPGLALLQSEDENGEVRVIIADLKLVPRK
jgi:hypothetical protein